MYNDIIVEACIESLEEAIYAKENGANQLEVCSLLDLDGLTPNEELIQDIINNANLPMNIMIRNRGGNFEYSLDEISAMIDDIQRLKSHPIKGIVFGATKKDEHNNTILDMSAIYQICKAAYPLPVTIHKAIDICDDILAEVRLLKEVFNVKYILSSGGCATAVQGADMLISLQNEVGSQIDIIAAGKITPDNLSIIREKSALTHFHGRKIV